MPTLFNLRTYLRDGDQFHLIDEYVSRDKEELETAARDRKRANPAYVMILLEFKRADAIII